MHSRSSAQPVSLQRRDVVIVGAGAAGLSAAVEISRAGRSVAVLEARDRVGGRMSSVPTGEAAVDLGATWFWGNEAAVRGVVDALGLPAFDQFLDGDAMFDSGAAAQRLDGNPIDAPSFRMVEGTQSIARALAALLPADVLRLGSPVSAVTIRDESMEVMTARGVIRAAHVIIAVPPALAAEQIDFTPDLPAATREAAEHTTVWMGAMVKAVAVYPRAFWREAGLSGSAISHVGPFREFHDHSGPTASPAALFGFAPSATFPQGDPALVEQAFITQLSRLFGPRASTPTSVHIVDWSRERYTSPRRPHPRAGSDTFGAEVFQHPVHDRLHFASTETAAAFAGHIEGAIRAGAAAAQRAMRLLRDA